MHPNAIKDLTQALATLASHTVIATVPDEVKIVPLSIHALYGIEFVIQRTGEEPLNRILAFLLDKHGWSEKYSKEFLKHAILTILARLLRDRNKDRLPEYVKDMVGDYEDFQDAHTVYVALGGIRMTAPAVEFGSVVLKTHSLKQLTSAPRRSLFFDDLPVTGDECVFAEYRCVAEPNRAIELAISATDLILSFLRYSIPFMFPNDKVQVGHIGEIQSTRWKIVAIREDEKSIRGNPRFFGPDAVYEIDEAALDRLKLLGSDTVSKIFKRARATWSEFEEILVRSLHWFSMGQREAFDANRLLNMMTSLEVFFTPEEKDPIANAIAEGVALVLPNRDLEERKLIKKQVKELYRSRSWLTHGITTDALRSDLDALAPIAGEVIGQLIARAGEFRTRNDLLNWIEEIKLGGQGIATTQ